MTMTSPFPVLPGHRPRSPAGRCWRILLVFAGPPFCYNPFLPLHLGEKRFTIVKRFTEPQYRFPSSNAFKMSFRSINGSSVR